MSPSITRRAALSAASAAAVAAALPAGLRPALAAPRTTFRLAWSIYTGYMPWPYAERSGILKKWADRLGVSIELVQVNDYVESINQFTAGQFDAVTATTMDALTIPAAGGVDTTILLIGDYSDGNDGIVLKGEGKTMADLKGKTVSLVQFSVSHYMLARALQTAGMAEADLRLQNISDTDFVAAFGTRGVDAVVAWNPAFLQIRETPGVSVVFQSNEIPGELVDVTFARTAALRDNPAFGKALAGAWYETLGLLRGGGAQAQEAVAAMAEMSGTTPESFAAQVKTTRFYYDPAEGAAFVRSPDMTAAMDRVRTFCFEQNLMGQGVTSKDAVGIALPGGEILGDPANVKLRLDAAFMQAAADRAI